MAERDAYYKLADLIEVDDTYFGAPKPGRRCRGAGDKAKVVVSVETKGDKPGFATMEQVEKLSGEAISQVLKDGFEEDVVSRTDGCGAYGVLNSAQNTHQPMVVGPGKNAAKVLPWVHTVITNVKSNIRGVYQGISHKHLSRYLSEFFYRYKRRFWEPQMFDRILTACVESTTIRFAEPKA